MQRLYARLCAWEARIAAAFLAGMALLIFTGSAARVAGHPLNWTIDAATCLFAWACFLCADIAWRRDKLMSVNVVTDLLPPRLQRACRIANLLVIIAFLVFVVGAGVWLAWTSRARSFQGIPAISYSWITLAMPAGAILLVVTAVLKLRAEAQAAPGGTR